MTRTRFGLYIYGSVEHTDSVELSGINTRIMAVRIFAPMAFLARLSAIVVSARVKRATKTMGELDKQDVIAAAVIGGKSLAGGGQRQSVAIARAVHFNAGILIMEEPSAALGPHETQMVAEHIQELRTTGLGVFLIAQGIHTVIKLCDRASVMKSPLLLGSVVVKDVTDDDIPGMIILGNTPAKVA